MLRIVTVALVPDGRVLFQPFSATVSGPVIMDGLPLVVASITDAGEVGRASVRTLRASNRRRLPARNIVRDPPDREFLEWYGASSYGAYSRGVRSVGLSATFDDVIAEVRITPNRNLGPRDGFDGIASERSLIEFSDEQQLGRAVQAAMAKATV